MSPSDQSAQALWYVAPGRAELHETRLPPLAAEAVRARALFGALSRGTEALVAGGRVPVSEYQRMRAPFMEGQFPFPVKYGYATVGLVEEGPAGMVGRMVFALYPHQTLFDVPASAVVPLPDEVPPQRAVLAANMETALNATWDAEVKLGARIAVVGAGVIGALVAYLCGQQGADVTLIDINPARADLAKALGVGFTTPNAMKGESDLVFHASGSAAGLATALSIATFEAAVVELSWYGDAQVPVPLGGAFHSRRLRLISSQVGHVAPSHRRDWTHHRRLTEAVRLLADPRLDALLSPPVAFRDLPTRLSDILDAKSGVLCQLIRYGA
jgi:NADPH:quinone reductase-like Zn-dependent oxidoreductase